MTPVLADVTQLGQEAAKLAAAALWPLADDELTACLHAAHRVERAAAALQARLVRQAEARGLPAAHGHRNTAGWLRAQLLLDPSPARDLADCAAALSRQPAVEQALLDGRVDTRQAAAIAATVDAASAGLADYNLTPAPDLGASDPDPGAADPALGSADPDVILERATTTLIEMAARLPAYQLRRVGDRILAHVAPHLAERADELALARQEARAHRARGFTLSIPTDGLVRLSGLLGLEDAAVLQASLQPLCTPAEDDERRPDQRRADALVEVCRLALRTGELPASGGEPTQLAVTVAYDPLTRALSTATTDTGAPLSPETARRLACDARILPAILGGAGQVLDVGRTQRLAPAGLRRALTLRDRGCAFPDCDRPPRWTDAHHVTPWLAGGPTALHNLVLLCRRHHRLIHHPTAGWQIRLNADQHLDFIPPPHVDPLQRPRRNLYRPPEPHLRC